MTDFVPIADIRPTLLKALAHVTLNEFVARSGVSRTTVQNIVHQRAVTTSSEIAENIKRAADELEQEQRDRFGWMNEPDVKEFIRQCRAGRPVIV